MLPLVLFSFGKLSSQVTIGSSALPSEASLLYLDASINHRALHLPRLTEADREALVPSGTPNVEARGLMIFNRDTQCLEFWNETEWVSLCVGQTPPLRPPANPNLPPPPTAAICLSGRTCFDVAQSHSNANFASDFDAPTARTFVLRGNATNTRFYVMNNEHNAVVALNQDDNTVEVVFRDDLEDVMTGENGVFTLVAQFNIGDGTERFQRSLNVRIQDNICCMVRSNSCEGSWLTFMCYNLGADPSVHNMTPAQQWSAPATARNGWLFQWGRQDDGHQHRNSPTRAGGFFTAGSLDAATGQPIGVDAHRFTITDGPAVPFYWGSSSMGANNNLWTRLDRINDPCPSGWRIPTSGEWNSIFAGNSGNSFSQNNGGFGFTPNDTGGVLTLFLPAAGRRRHNGVVDTSPNGAGFYNTSDSNSHSFRGIHFNNQPGAGIIVPTRVDGLSVRCIAE